MAADVPDDKKDIDPRPKLCAIDGGRQDDAPIDCDVALVCRCGLEVATLKGSPAHPSVQIAQLRRWVGDRNFCTQCKTPAADFVPRFSPRGA